MKALFGPRMIAVVGASLLASVVSAQSLVVQDRTDAPPAARARLPAVYVDALFGLRVAPLPPRAIPSRGLPRDLREAIADARAASRWGTRPPRAGVAASYTRWMQRALQDRAAAVRTAEQALARYDTTTERNVDTLIASAMVAQLYFALGSDLVALPLPPEIQADDALAAAFRERIADHSAPLFARASGAFAFCASQPACQDPSLVALCDHCRVQSETIARVLALAPTTP